MREHTYLRDLSVRTARAARWGKTEEEQWLRRETRLAKIEDAIARQLDGIVLTRAEADRLVAAVVAFRDRAELEADAMASAGDALRLAELLIDRLQAGQDPGEAMQGAVREHALVVVSSQD